MRIAIASDIHGNRTAFEATRKIRKMLPQTQVLVLSLYYSDQLVREIVDAGARAYVLKSDASAEVLIAIESPCQ
jgi:DNA-binding NarL/FixJ family response regulator